LNVGFLSANILLAIGKTGLWASLKLMTLIAIPLLVGPGAITTTIFNLQSYGSAVTIIAVIVVLAITWLILRYINAIYRVLGKTGALVIARAMALLIAAIAVQYILNGITHYITTST
jgi:multiple antibiotic resistance protein